MRTLFGPLVAAVILSCGVPLGNISEAGEYLPAKYMPAKKLVVTVHANVPVLPERDQRDDDRLWLAMNVHFESRGETALDKRMVALVTLNRVKANSRHFGGSNVHDVVFHRFTNSRGKTVCAFTWTCSDDYWERWEDASDEEKSEAFAAVDDVLAGNFVPPAHLAAADHYMNPRTAHTSSRCWFNGALIKLGKVVNHHYFRTPSDLDVLFLQVQQPAKECKKYARR